LSPFRDKILVENLITHILSPVRDAIKPNIMANTYTQIHIQAVFTVQDRDSIILSNFKDELYKYITGIVQNNKHKLLAINGMPDHIHILFGFRPSQSLSDLMQDIKGASSRWINEKRFVRSKFSWQEGYGAFSYSRADVPTIIRYILQQQEHHKRRNFIEEYLDLLKESEIEYDDRFVFRPLGINYSVPDGT
jgi:REP element-mobilizing transposase RayT